MVITAKGIKVPVTFTSYWKQKNNVKFTLYNLIMLAMYFLHTFLKVKLPHILHIWKSCLFI